MTNVLNLLPNAVGQKPTPVVYGEVATGQPAPTSFADSLKVVIPDWNPEVYFAIDDWPAVHGTTLPAQGAPCLLEYDNQGELRCTWWKGSTGFGFTRGTGSLIFSASTSATATVTHGLGATPAAVVATAHSVSGQLVMHADTFTGTTFTATGALTPSGSGTFSFSWVAYA